MLKAFKDLFRKKKTTSSKDNTAVLYDMVLLLEYVEKKIDHSPAGKKLNRSIQQFRTASNSQKLKEFPNLYLSIESFFKAQDAEKITTEASRFRNLLESRLIGISRHLEFQLLFKPESIQERILCFRILEELLLQAHKLNIDHEAITDFQFNLSDSDTMFSYKKQSLRIFEFLKQEVGEQVATSLFLNVYTDLFEKYHRFDAFASTLGILPSAVFEAEFIHTKSPKKLNKVYQKYIQKLQGDTTSLVQRMEEQQAEVDAYREDRFLKSKILETSLDAYFLFSADTRIKDWNRQAEKLFGWKHQEAIGRSILDFIDSDSLRERIKTELEAYQSTGTSNYINSRVEVSTNDRAGNTLLIEVAIRSIELNQQLLFSAFARDITPRIASEPVLTR